MEVTWLVVCVLLQKYSPLLDILKYGRNAVYRKNMMKCERMLFLDSCVSRGLENNKRLFGTRYNLCFQKKLNFFNLKLIYFLMFL
jgi:hypothetical protein